MKIYGPYTRKDKRQHIIKIDDNGNRCTQSYPRYLMESYLKRKLLCTEEVDHKDNDPTNNSINNLQILTGKLNRQKEMSRPHRIKKMFNGICLVCNTSFSKSLAQVNGNKKKGKKGPFCSRKCAGKYR